mmetsp:Transcript_34187/g.88264  ORF Transcript_34187/g.88264 Transcript_34187/m.88264 type:complete len:222 (+) Transcript_34187:2454-3119(+)
MVFQCERQYAQLLRIHRRSHHRPPLALLLLHLRACHFQAGVGQNGGEVEVEGGGRGGNGEVARIHLALARICASNNVPIQHDVNGVHLVFDQHLFAAVTRIIPALRYLARSIAKPITQVGVGAPRIAHITRKVTARVTTLHVPSSCRGCIDAVASIPVTRGGVAARIAKPITDPAINAPVRAVRHSPRQVHIVHAGGRVEVFRIHLPAEHHVIIQVEKPFR